jgi:hypothetical protein
MKCAPILVVVAAVVCLSARGAFAQTPAYHSFGGGSDHVEAGVFGEFYNWNQASTNLAGVGARVGFNVAPLVQFEGEMSYDFDQVFAESFSDGSISRTNVRRIDGLFGPKLETNHGPVRFFLTAKGGGTSFGFNPHGVSFATFGSTLENLRTSDVTAEFYPGAGVEAFLGPIGLRLDVGDEMYFTNDVHHNVRVAFGPTIRF